MNERERWKSSKLGFRVRISKGVGRDEGGGSSLGMGWECKRKRRAAVVGKGRRCRGMRHGRWMWLVSRGFGVVEIVETADGRSQESGFWLRVVERNQDLKFRVAACRPSKKDKIVIKN